MASPSLALRCALLLERYLLREARSPFGILRQLKQQAAAEGKTLQDLTNALLRRALATRDREPYTLDLTGWQATLQPGADILDRDALFDVMNGR